MLTQGKHGTRNDMTVRWMSLRAKRGNLRRTVFDM